MSAQKLSSSSEGTQLTNELNSQAETYLNKIARLEDQLYAAANQSRKLSPSLLPLFIFCTWILRLSSHETDRQWHLNILKALIGNGGQEGIPGMSLVLKTDQEAKELLNWVQVKLGKKEEAPTDQEISEIVTGGISNLKHLLRFFDNATPESSAAAQDSSGDNVKPAAESGGKTGKPDKAQNQTARGSSSSAKVAQAKPAKARKASPLIVGRGAALEPTVDETASLSEAPDLEASAAKSLKFVITPQPKDLLVQKGAEVEGLQTMLVDFLSTIRVDIKHVKSEAQLELRYDTKWEEATGMSMISELGRFLRLPGWMTGSKAWKERAKQREANAKEVRSWLKHAVDENRLPDSCKESYRKLLETPITEIWKRRLNICFPKERTVDTSSQSLRKCQTDVFLQTIADARHCFLMTECVLGLFRLQLTAELEMHENKVKTIAHAIAANTGRDLKGEALEKAVKKAKTSDWSGLPDKQQFHKKAVLKAEEAIALFPPLVKYSSVKDIEEKMDEYEKKLESLEKFFSGKQCKWRGRR